jgi:DinB superfamily
MQPTLDHTISLLSHTPSTLNALLRDLPVEFISANEGANTWTPIDVVGHLISGERTDWLPRARIILQFGESRTFDPFDMQGHLREIEGKSLPHLLDDFADLRTNNLFELRSWKLQPADLDKRGVHPSQGVVTLSQLLATWAAHDLTHLHQLSRILAYPYRDAVGSWSKFLGVLHCNGHSTTD